jgi:membrane protein EpsK
LLLWRRLTPQLIVQRSAFDLGRLRELVVMSGWMTVNGIGSLLFLNIDLIVVNRFFGAEMGGRYGAVLSLAAYVRVLVNRVVAVLTPTIVAKYAEGDTARINAIARQSVRLLGTCLALPVGLLFGFAGPLLAMWLPKLGPSFRDVIWLLRFLSAHLCLNLAVTPLFSVQIAANKVRLPGLVTLAMGGLNLSLAVALSWWGGWGMIGVAVAGAVTLTLKNAVFTPLYCARIQSCPLWYFLPGLLPGIAGTAAVGASAYVISDVFAVDSWTVLALWSLGLSLAYATAAWAVTLNRGDRELLMSFVARAGRHG